LPSFNKALRRGSQTSTRATWGCSRSYSHAAQVPSSQFASQTMDKLQNAAGFGFHDRRPTAPVELAPVRLLVSDRQL